MRTTTMANISKDRLTGRFLAFLLLVLANKETSSFCVQSGYRSRHYFSANFLSVQPSDVARGSSTAPAAAIADAPTGSIYREETVDVVVIGAGVGGLSCAALSSKYGMDTLCLEAHDTAGGCAHSFERYSAASKTTPFRFDSGPSLVSGLSEKGTNPLRQVLDAVGTAEEVQWKTYDGWLVHDTSDDKVFKVTTGDSGAFEDALEKKAGINAKREFIEFKRKVLEEGGLAEASAYIPPFALRGGITALASLANYMFKLLSIGSKGALLTGPFSKVMDLHGLKDPFVRKWFDYLAFALSGVDASHTQAAAVAYMMMDLHKKDAVLDYPMGGMDSLVQALVSGIKTNGGELRLNSRVERMILEDNNGRVECKGVVLTDGTVVNARKGVVSNAPIWNMARILEDSVPGEVNDARRSIVKAIQKQADDMSMTGSFMHLHLGIPKAGLPEHLECHHSVLNMQDDVTAEQNMVIISIPTVFDPSLAPEGYHVVHAYTAACDGFDQWTPYLDSGKETGKVGHSPNSVKSLAYTKVDGYNELKDEKADVLWRAVERVIPDVRLRAKQKGSIILVGTPLTHRRYNQRYRGTYGPAPGPGKDVWELAGATTKIKGLLACGDSTFPGIGLPGVAASGTIAANTMTTIANQRNLMKELKAKGALQ
jgi:phytoene dehydrogenase-like protein